ncbi:MAG TPA: DUF308 domain-containing protein [Gammaproteobacteria bacterium]|nr:DUF308 domain-containing protein [Gammaproteobacteria bacterium]
MFLLLGIAAIVFPFAASVAVTILLGALLLVGGIATAIRAFAAKYAPYRGSSISLAIVTIITGLLLLIFVPASLLALTITLAAFFIVQGIFEIMHGVQARGQRGRGWLIASGIAGVIVGVLLWLGWPSTAVWAIGTLAGINFLLTGSALLMLGSQSVARQEGLS